MREVRAKRGAEGQESPEVPQRVCMGHREGRWQTVCLLLYPVPCVQGELWPHRSVSPRCAAWLHGRMGSILDLGKSMLSPKPPGSLGLDR